ncbi:MAG: UDP-N-acetylmuramoyl-tripeptide--D-alanyl-D-alanine ligase [Hymenobacteraceae bacterium]|nr:UDP-N-acetylmuramoyl-tripeptide--D-alanyl-D-alanine ligase [Hymenobacteraceae bacterium]
MSALASAPLLPPDLLIRLYQQYESSNRLASTDSRSLPAGALFFALNGARRGAAFAAGALAAGAAHAVIDDPELAATDPERYTLVAEPLAALQALALHHRRQFRGAVVAPTGSNGKTTTKELLAGVLGGRYRTLATLGNFNNHIGVPLTLLRLDPAHHEVAVVEMGANHPREIAELAALAEPTHGLITNIGKAHLEGFGGTLAHVARAKGELFEYLTATGGTAFLNLADPHLAPWAARLPGAIGYPAPARLLGAEPFVVLTLGAVSGPLTTQLSGAYNFENLAAAAVVGRFFGVADDDIRAALAAYAPTNNRSQLAFRAATGNHLTLDAYNANPSSVGAAVRHFATLPATDDAGQPLPKLLILGDMLELGEASAAEHRALGELLAELGLRDVLLVGPHMAAAAEVCSVARHFGTKAEAAAWLTAHPVRGRRVLLKGSRGIGLETLVELL